MNTATSAAVRDEPDLAAPVEPLAAPAFSRGYRTYVLVALAVVGFMCAVDRVVISMFMEPIRKEIGKASCRERV